MATLRRVLVPLLAATLLALGLVTPPGAHAGGTAQPWAKRIWGYLTTADGVHLRYSVLLPRAHGRFPVLINYSGYDAGTIGGVAYQQGNTWMETDLDARLLKAGFAVMGLQMRGTGCSSGTFDLFGSTWGTDGARGVEWAAHQPWSTGRVGMYLWSWPGISQLFVAADRPPGLDAIAPGEVVTDPLRDVGAPGGVPDPQFVTLWWGTIMDSWTYVAADAEGDGDAECLVDLARNYAQGQSDSPVSAADHLFEDSYWAARDLRRQTARIRIPVLSLTDWQDEEVGARGGYYQDVLDPTTTWWVGTNGEHDIYLSARFDRMLIAFFDHYLKGSANGFARTPHVQLWMNTTSPGGPQASDAQLEQAAPSYTISQPNLPLRVRRLTFYLSDRGELTPASPTTASGSQSYAPTPGPVVNDDVPGAISGGSGGPDGEQTWQSYRPPPGGELAFTTPPLRNPLTLAGSASLNFWLSSTAPDTDVQVTLTEVRPDGEEQYVQRGWLRMSERAIDPALSSPLLPVHLQTLASVAPLVPDRPVLARIEIPQFAQTFPVGSSIRIWLDAPSGTGDWNFASEPFDGVDTVWSDHARPSSFVVGVVSAGTARGGYPSCATLVGEPCRVNPLPVPRT